MLLTETQKKINEGKVVTIRLENERIFKHKTPVEFIKKYFDSNNPPTIQVFKSTTRRCRWSSRRSLPDLYLLVKNYYPDFTLRELLIILEDLLDKIKINCMRCDTINKLVFWKRNYRYGGRVSYNTNRILEKGMTTYNKLIEEIEREKGTTRRSNTSNKREQL